MCSDGAPHGMDDRKKARERACAERIYSSSCNQPAKGRSVPSRLVFFCLTISIVSLDSTLIVVVLSVKVLVKIRMWRAALPPSCHIRAISRRFAGIDQPLHLCAHEISPLCLFVICKVERQTRPHRAQLN